MLRNVAKCCEILSWCCGRGLGISVTHAFPRGRALPFLTTPGWLPHPLAMFSESWWSCRRTPDPAATAGLCKCCEMLRNHILALWSGLGIFATHAVPRGRAGRPLTTHGWLLRPLASFPSRGARACVRWVARHCRSKQMLRNVAKSHPGAGMFAKCCLG